MLDKWVEDQSKEMEDRAKKNTKSYKPSSAYDHDEVIHFDQEEWEELSRRPDTPAEEEHSEDDEEYDDYD